VTVKNFLNKNCYTTVMKKLILSFSFLLTLLMPATAHGLSLVPCKDVVKNDKNVSLSQCECEQKKMLEAYDSGRFDSYDFEKARKDCASVNNGFLENDGVQIATAVVAVLALAFLLSHHSRRTNRPVTSTRRSRRKK
jgi:hypothetical protein